MLLQPSQRLETLALNLIPLNIELTIPIHAPRRAPELNRIHNQPDDPEDEQDERAHDHDPGEELPLGDQPEHYGDEEEREGGYGDPVGEIPRDPNLQLLLHGQEARINSQDRRGAHDHDQEPEVQLQGRPVVFGADSLDDQFGHC